jgi:hypothetical protein
MPGIDLAVVASHTCRVRVDGSAHVGGPVMLVFQTEPVIMDYPIVNGFFTGSRSVWSQAHPESE